VGNGSCLVVQANSVAGLNFFDATGTGAEHKLPIVYDNAYTKSATVTVSLMMHGVSPAPVSVVFLRRA
jgi:hypothetical protein